MTWHVLCLSSESAVFLTARISHFNLRATMQRKYGNADVNGRVLEEAVICPSGLVGALCTWQQGYMYTRNRHDLIGGDSTASRDLCVHQSCWTWIWSHPPSVQVFQLAQPLSTTHTINITHTQGGSAAAHFHVLNTHSRQN